MTEATIISNLTIALKLFMLIVTPPLLVATCLGLLVSIIQAATQLQDQTMPLVIKLMAIVLVFAVFSPTLISPLLSFSEQVFQSFPEITR